MKKVLLKPAICGVDLGDGSERAEYVNQDYILHTLGRPHRNINIMYTYYPKDKEWPGRISEVCKDMDIKFQWDYPYDDYFPYEGGLGKHTRGEPFAQMRDIRRHGQDVTLTLTIDCSLEDEYLVAIAKDLRNFGRMRLRINHECTGDWFTHSRRFSLTEIVQFFVHFSEIIRKEAPNVQIVFCGGCVEDLEDPEMKLGHEEDLIPAYQAADYWSMDCYLALHYGWPFDICEKDCNSFAMTPVDKFYQCMEKSAKRFAVLNHGEVKPLVISEFNTDGDVTGPFHQHESIKKLIAKIKANHAEEWFGGFTLYQFRDRGRLGLEIEDPNNASVGIRQPLLDQYKEMIRDPYFQPKFEEQEESSLPMTLRWGGAEDAEGFATSIVLEKTPEFFEMILEKEVNFMIKVGDYWFYKAPGVARIDLMGMFFDRPLEGETELPVYIFAPPASGENDSSQGEDWAENYYYTMKKAPEFRVRYEPVCEVAER